VHSRATRFTNRWPLVKGPFEASPCHLGSRDLTFANSCTHCAGRKAALKQPAPTYFSLAPTIETPARAGHTLLALRTGVLAIRFHRRASTM